MKTPNTINNLFHQFQRTIEKNCPDFDPHEEVDGGDLEQGPPCVVIIKPKETFLSLFLKFYLA